MSDAIIIELNDSGILMAGATGIITSAPGYARLTTDGIQTGEEARRHAFLEPQRVYHQYWNQLSLAPLNGAHGHARHHADLAYNQLLHLHRAAGQPQHVFFSVPGTFSREQLSILLGLAQASPFTAIGLVDSAVAALAGLDETGDWLHLDIHLHQAVLTRVRLGEGLERLEVQAIAQAGLRTLLGNWAQHIAHLFIHQYRYDPLHTAAGEQQLYDRMNDWLSGPTLERDLTLDLDSRRGTYSMSVPAESFICSNANALQALQHAIQQSGNGAGLALSDRLARLPRLQEQLAVQVMLPVDVATRNAYLCQEQLGPVNGGLVLHTRLQRRPSTAETALDMRQIPAREEETPATHLLFRHRAHAIGERLYIGFDGEELSFGQQSPPAPWLCLIRAGSQLTLHSEGEVPISTSDGLAVGSVLSIRFPNAAQVHELVLIEVG